LYEPGEGACHVSPEFVPAALAAIFSVMVATEGSAQSNSPTLDQLKKTNTTNTDDARREFDRGLVGRRTQRVRHRADVAPPVQANVAAKPNPVGLPVQSTATTPDSSPQLRRFASPVPSPGTTTTATPAPVDTHRDLAPVVKRTATPTPVVTRTATPTPVATRTATPAPVVTRLDAALAGTAHAGTAQLGHGDRNGVFPLMADNNDSNDNNDNFKKALMGANAQRMISKSCRLF
jgi:hypothetical protein